MPSAIPTLPPNTRAREVSVVALIEDATGQVLLVKQSAGKKLWSLPGGKVREKESLERALQREVSEEVGAKIRASTLLDIYDRTEKKTLTILYRVTLQTADFKPRAGEIERIAFRASLPRNATPSAKYFWPWAHRNNGDM